MNKNSTAYKAGVVAGTVLDVALTPVNPCGKVKVAEVRGQGIVGGPGGEAHGLAAGEAFAQGDVTSGMLSLVAARSERREAEQILLHGWDADSDRGR